MIAVTRLRLRVRFVKFGVAIAVVLAAVVVGGVSSSQSWSMLLRSVLGAL